MRLSPRKNGLTSLFKEVRVFKPFFTQISGRHFLPELCGEDLSWHWPSPSCVLCPWPVQNRALFEGKKRAKRCQWKGRKRSGQQRGQKRKKGTRENRSVPSFLSNVSHSSGPAQRITSEVRNEPNISPPVMFLGMWFSWGDGVRVNPSWSYSRDLRARLRGGGGGFPTPGHCPEDGFSTNFRWPRAVAYFQKKSCKIVSHSVV